MHVFVMPLALFLLLLTGDGCQGASREERAVERAPDRGLRVAIPLKPTSNLNTQRPVSPNLPAVAVATAPRSNATPQGNPITFAHSNTSPQRHPGALARPTHAPPPIPGTTRPTLPPKHRLYVGFDDPLDCGAEGFALNRVVNTVRRVELAGQDYLHATGLTFPGTKAFLSFHNTSTCGCRWLCAAHPACVAFTHAPLETKAQCRLADHSLPKLTLQEMVNTHFFLKMDSLPVGYTVQEDFLLYYRRPEETKMYGDVQPFCESIPGGGGRFAVFKTADQARILDKFDAQGGSTLGLHLINSPAGPVWGDGTFLNTTELIHVINVNATGPALRSSGENFFYHDRQIHMQIKKQKIGFACQANPFKVSW